MKILPNPMPHKSITCCIADLPPLAVRWPRGTFEEFIDRGADGAEGRAWSDTRDAYLGAFLGYAEQVFARCVL